MAFASINEIQIILAQSFFGGDMGIAGITMYAVVLAVIFVLFAKNNLMVGFALIFPVTFIFVLMGIIPETFTVLMIIVAIVGLAKERVSHQG